MHFVCHKNLEVKYMACRANDVEEHCILETVKWWLKKKFKKWVFFIF